MRTHGELEAQRSPDVPSRRVPDAADGVSLANTATLVSEAPVPDPKWPRTWRAYACMLGCFFLMFNSWGLVNAYGTFSSFYVANSLRDVDQLELNLIGSTQSFLVLIFSGLVGRLLDAGHFRKVIGTGAFLVPFGLFMLTVAHPARDGQRGSYGSIWATQGLVTGLGMSCFFVSSSQVAATWFPNRKGLAVGFVACGASIAGVVYPTMLRFLIDALGFVNATRGVAGLVALTSLFSLVFSAPDPAHPHPRPATYRSVKVWIDPDAFRNKAYIWFTLAVAFLFFGFYPVFFNLEEWAAVGGYGTRKGATVPVSSQSSTKTPLQTFWLLTIMNGCSTLGRLIMATWSDKTGQLNMHIVAQIISSLLVLILWTLARSTTAAILFCVFFGISSGAVIGLPPASVANILHCTYNTPETQHLARQKLGHWTGMMYTIAAIPSLVGPVVAGHLVTEYRTYVTVQMWAGVNLAISAVCMVVARWYLPTVEGSSVKDALAGFMGRVARRGSDDEDEKRVFDSDLSRITTRVPSRVVSRKPSEDGGDIRGAGMGKEVGILGRG